MKSQRKSLVVGIGNSMRGDDGIGASIVKRLSDAQTSEAFDTLVVHQLLPEHAEMLRPYHRVIFVDACADLPAGQWKLTRIAASSKSASSTHVLEPSSLLTLAKSLFDATSEAWCLRVGAEQFETTLRLSRKASMAIDCCLPQLMALLGFQGEAAHA